MENICYRDQAFLNATPITEHNILDYFATSQFYDSSCTNEILKMQTKYANPNTPITTLDQLNGIQYILHDYNEERSLFTVYKIDRFSPKDFDILVVYYVMFGNIYQSPVNHSLFNGRLANHYHLVNEVLDLYEESVRYDVFKGFYIPDADMGHETVTNERKTEADFFYDVLNGYLKSKIN